MEDNKVQMLRDLIETAKVYVEAEKKEDLEKVELQAKFDALVAENAELTPLVQELKAQLELLKNSVPVV